MNQLVHSNVLTGEVLDQNDTVRVLVTANPFKPATREIMAPSGLSLVEIVALAGEGRFAYAASIAGNVVQERNWRRIRPKAGTTVVLRARLADPVSAIFAAISAAVSSITVSSIVGSVLTIAAGIGFKLLIGMLFPPPKPKEIDNTEGVKGYSLSASRNQIGRFEAIPVVLGEHRVSPFYGAQPFTQSDGPDQYLCMLFVWGIGPLDVTDIRIGETPLHTFSDVQMEQFIGYPGQAIFSNIYPFQVVEEPLSIELKMEDEWTYRTTAENITRLSVDLFWQNGLYVQFAKSGDKQPLGAEIEIHVRPVGGEWKIWGKFTFTGYWLKDAHRETLSLDVSEGQYELRIRKAFEHPESNDHLIVDTVYLTAIRGTRPGRPITFDKPLCVTALRIRATSQLNNQLETLNGIVRAIHPNVYGTPNITSRSPADLFLLVLQGAGNARPVASVQIDFDTLRRWYNYCAAEGWSYDAVITSRRPVYDMLIEIAAAGRAVPIFRDGLWSVVWDEPAAQVVQVFTPRNSWGFEASKEFPDMPHGWRTRFVNRDKGYIDDERIVYDDGYNASNATKFEALEFPGVTDPALIWRHGRFHLAQLRLRPEIYTLNVDFENLIVTRGDRVRIAHDVMLVGICAARVTAVNAVTRSITLDEVVTIEAGKVYALRARSAAGDLTLYSVNAPIGEERTLQLAGVAPLPEVGDLCTFGEGGKDSAIYRVLSIERQSELTATLTFVDDAPEIAFADRGAIPAFQSNVTAPIDPYIVVPTDVRASARAYIENFLLTASIVVSWQVPRQGKIARYQIEIQNAGAKQSPWSLALEVQAPATSGEIRGVASGLYGVRVRAIFNDGTFSRWVVTPVVSTKGVLTPPPAVTRFQIATRGDISTLTWDASTDPSVQFYEVRFSKTTDDWNTAVPIADRAMPGVQVPTMVGFYLIKAGRPDGARSKTAAVIRSAVAALTGFNVVATIDEAAGGFVGARQKVVLHDGTLRLAPRAVMSSWASLSSVISLRVGNGGADTIGLAVEGIYSFAGSIDLGQVFTSRMTSSLKAYGVNIGMIMRSWLRLSDVTKLSSTDPSQWAVEMEYQATNGDPAGNAVWTNWQRVVVGDVTARALRFRLRLIGNAVGTLERAYSMVTPVVQEASVSIDMPDRTIGLDDIAVPAAGQRVTFNPPFRAAPAIATNDQGMETGDVKVLSDKTADGFNIRFFDMHGVPVARTIDVVAKGYGSMTP